mgnify:CR=1 FL=1
MEGVTGPEFRRVELTNEFTVPVPVERAWEQGWDGGTPPAAFGYGSEFTTAG